MGKYGQMKRLYDDPTWGSAPFYVRGFSARIIASVVIVIQPTIFESGRSNPGRQSVYYKVRHLQRRPDRTHCARRPEELERCGQ